LSQDENRADVIRVVATQRRCGTAFMHGGDGCREVALRAAYQAADRGAALRQ
jgi:hypothetical protein